MKILVTGTDGYLGCLLAPELLRDGHDVVGVDTGFYKAGWLYNGVDATAQRWSRTSVTEVETTSRASTRSCTWRSCPTTRWVSCRRRSPTRSTTTARSDSPSSPSRPASSRFVYMSSCSVYGVADGEVDETSPINPQTAYAECKALVERDVTALADDNFSPTFLRNATAFGASPRMRFDIVLNNLSGLAYTTGKIAMTSDGTPWRPLVHGLDIAKAIRCALDAPRELVHNEVFNVGSQRAELPGPRDRRDRRQRLPRL